VSNDAAAPVSHRPKGARRMTDTEALSARVDALEMRAAEQERTIDDLNTTIIAQWKEIESLNRQLARLGAQLQEIEARSPAGGPEPPPPHY
jgi:SlyX protein